MFRPKYLKILSIVAMVLSVLALLISALGMMSVPGNTLSFCLAIVSWSLFLWSSVLANQLAQSNLHERDYKKLGWYLIVIIAAFVLFLFFGLIFGILVSIFILFTFRQLKKDYNSVTVEDPAATDVTDVDVADQLNN